MRFAPQLDYRKRILGRYELDIQAGAKRVGGLDFLPVVYWYDKTHIASVKYYKDFVYGSRYPEIDVAAVRDGERLKMVRPTEVARDMRREMESAGASANTPLNKDRESNEEIYTRLWQHRGKPVVQRGICFIEDALGKMLLHEIKVAVAEAEIEEMKKVEARVSRRQLDPSRWLAAHKRYGTFVYVDDLGMGRGGGGEEGGEGVGEGGEEGRGGAGGSSSSSNNNAKTRKGHDLNAPSSAQGEVGAEGELVPHIRHSHGRKFLTVEKKTKLYGEKAKRGGGRDLSAWHGEIEVDLGGKA